MNEYKRNRFHKTDARKWTKEEELKALQLRSQGFSKEEIAKALDRSLVSIGIKLKRLGKKDNTYNAKHVEEKYKINHEFMKVVQPKKILDLYCGAYSFYKTHYQDLEIVTNDINKAIAADYHMDALKALCLLYGENRTFDLIDLDSFGSAADCFDLAIKASKKGLIITLGEMGHLRWKRLDYVGRYYGITSLEEFTTETLIAKIIEQGKRHKKLLKPYAFREWHNISRVWFLIEPLKIL